MTNPTSNYSWQMPTSTDLVTDLPADFEVFGQAVDTTTKALNPSTTLGDIEYRSATANTNTRLGIGTSGQVLTVSGGVPAWTTASGGGLTLISTTTMSGASILLSSIPQTYKNLRLVFRNYTPATGGENLTIRVNDDSNANRHQYNQQDFFAGPFNATYIRMSHNTNSASTASGQFEFLDYASTGTWKMGFGYDANNSNNVAGEVSGGTFIGAYNQTGAITSLRLAPTSGNFTSGTILLYGVS